MSYEEGGSLLDYAYCSYGAGKDKFRGPEVEICDKTIAFLEAGETFGRFAVTPFVSDLGLLIDRPCANFGQIGAGVDAFIRDTDVQRMCRRSSITVIQIMGAQNVSNRLYLVHPTRNDRFISPSSMMKTIFEDVEFTDYNFVQHMLSSIKQQSPDRYSIIVQELKTAWVARMKEMLANIGGRVILLWLPCKSAMLNTLGEGPLYVDAQMIEELRGSIESIVRPDLGIEPNDPTQDGLLYSPFDQAAASLAMTQDEHHLVAKMLATEIIRMSP